MRDPFPIPCPALLQSFIQPYSTALGLSTLPAHVHEILFSLIFYTLIGSYISPAISRRLLPKTYGNFNTRTRVNWDVHVVSLVQSLLICALSLYSILCDEERKNFSWAGRLWGYTGLGGLAQAMGVGYFLWDLVITARHIDIFGPGTLVHAIAALGCTGLCFRPIFVWYSPVFLLYELSSPFLNLHWFMDKLNMTGSALQWLNGIILIASFFLARIVWGFYNYAILFHDVYQAYKRDRIRGGEWFGLELGRSIDESSKPPNYFVSEPIEKSHMVAGQISPLAEVSSFAVSLGQETIPLWLVAIYMASIVVLSLLNIVWLGKMIETIRKRFPPPFGTARVDADGVAVADQKKQR